MRTALWLLFELGVESRFSGWNDGAIADVALFTEFEVDVHGRRRRQVLQCVGAAAVGDGGVGLAIGQFQNHIDAGDGHAGFEVGNLALKLPVGRRRRVELVPDGNGEGRDDEDGRDGLDGPPERERPAEGAAQHGGNLDAVRVADALNLKHGRQRCAVKKPGKDRDVESLGAGVFEGDVIGAVGVLRPAQDEGARAADGVVEALLPLFAGVDGLHVEEDPLAQAAQLVDQRLDSLGVGARVAEKNVVTGQKHGLSVA